MVKLKRPTNDEELYDAVHMMQLSQVKLEVMIGGHPEIEADSGLCGTVAQNCEDINGLKTEVGKVRSRINYILGAFGALALLGGIVALLNYIH